MALSPSSSPPTQLLALSALGLASLWGGMWFNGTLDGLLRIQQTASFPDGRPMRTRFTGYPLIDSAVMLLVAFFDLISDTKGHAAAPWLLFDLGSLLAAINTWVLIESRRRGVRNLFLRHTILFIFLWNSLGAAFVTPIYFYLIARSRHTSRDATVPLNEARAFPVTLVVNALFPLVFFVDGGSDYDRHGFIAMYNLTPIYMVLCIVVCSRPGTSVTRFESPKDDRSPNEDAPWVVASLCATGTLTAAQHLYTGALLLASAGDTGLSWTRVFVPSASRVFSSPHGSQTALVEGAHLFTQLDWWITAAACVVFTHHLLREAGSGNERTSKGMSLFWISLAAFVLGPAAAGSFAMMIREKRLRTAVQAHSTLQECAGK